jgi:hypothetical protein
MKTSGLKKMRLGGSYMTRPFFVVLALIAVLAVGAAWYVSGQLGYERGYKPEHTARADLQVRLDALRDCLNGVKNHTFYVDSGQPYHTGAYKLGWILSATEDCNRKAGFDYFTAIQLKTLSR